MTIDTPAALASAYRTLHLATTPAYRRFSHAGRALLPQRRHPPTTRPQSYLQQRSFQSEQARSTDNGSKVTDADLDAEAPSKTDGILLEDPDEDHLGLQDNALQTVAAGLTGKDVEPKKKAQKVKVKAKEKNGEDETKEGDKVDNGAGGLLDLIMSNSENPHSLKARNSDWETGWGRDMLQPSSLASNLGPTAPKSGKRPKSDLDADKNSQDALPPIPFEKRPPWLMFTRRIDGVIEPDKLPQALEYISPPSPQLPIAQLKHHLDRVLFNPGVHWVQDPRSRVYNFDPYLQEIPAVTDFAFERVNRFLAPSQDPDLQILAQQEDKRFSGSTSSLSGILCHIYFLLSSDRLLDTVPLSRNFHNEARRFTAGQRMPSSVVFNYKDGRYTINASAEKSGDAEKNILTWMGTMLEKFLTVPKQEFSMYRRSNADAVLPDQKPMREAFRFAKSEKFVMRSQLDCYDPRLPGTGVFDIKTRACMPIRLDLFNFEENSGYLIRKQHGKFESFEREYYDLIRSAFLKYQFQARIGDMDGVIVAYHNTKQMFGFQYIPLEEMDQRLFGDGTGLGDRVFKACLGILENVAEEVVGCFPNQSVRAMFETLEGSGVMKVWVEPLEWDGEKEEEKRPIKQLQVRTWSYLDSTLAKPWEAFRDKESKYSVRWSIAHPNASREVIRKQLLGAKQRQFRAWVVPTGVDPDDLQEWYESLNFGGGGESTGVFNPNKFTVEAGPGLARLRELAREGRRETERLRELEEGKPRHVLSYI